MRIIDLRSDTVTLPTPAMQEAIYRAELGDDMFGEDPTTNRLEKMAAEYVGKQAAMLVVSGTMGNLVCLLTHCGRGEEAIVGDKSHVFLYETGGMSALGGIHPYTVSNQPDGTMRLEDIEAAIRIDDVHCPRTRLICLENTHNYCNGFALTPEYTDKVSALAGRRGILVHLDGARIFNAAVALGVDVKELTRNVDSLSFCLSKGLSAPVGSVVCGSREFIAETRRIRKVLGGGMRQSGIIAAPAIIALEQMVDRLDKDHANARRLTNGIAGIQGLSIDPKMTQTNIVYFNLASVQPRSELAEPITAENLVRQLDRKGIKVLCSGLSRIRAVTHYGIRAEDIDLTLAALRKIMEQSYLKAHNIQTKKRIVRQISA